MLFILIRFVKQEKNYNFSMLPSSRNFLLQLKNLSFNDNYDEFESYIVKNYGQEASWRQRLKPILNKLNIKSGLLQHRTVFIKQFVKQRTTEQIILLTKQLLKQKAIQQTHLIHFNLGQLYTQSGEINKAIFAYETSLKQFPGFYPSVLNYTNLLKKQNRGDQALYYLQRWLKYYKPNYKIEAQYLSLCNQNNIHQVYKIFKGRKLHPFVEYNLALYLKNIGLDKEASDHFKNINFDNLHGIIQPKHQQQIGKQQETKTNQQKIKKFSKAQKLEDNDLHETCYLNSLKLKQLLDKKKSLNHFYLTSQYQPPFQTEPQTNYHQRTISKTPYNLSSLPTTRNKINQKNSLSKIKKQNDFKHQPKLSSLLMNPLNVYNIQPKLSKRKIITKRQYETQSKVEHVQQVNHLQITRKRLFNNLKQNKNKESQKTLRTQQIKKIDQQLLNKKQRNMCNLTMNKNSFKALSKIFKQKQDNLSTFKLQKQSINSHKCQFSKQKQKLKPNQDKINNLNVDQILQQSQIAKQNIQKQSNKDRQQIIKDHLKRQQKVQQQKQQFKQQEKTQSNNYPEPSLNVIHFKDQNIIQKQQPIFNTQQNNTLSQRHQQVIKDQKIKQKVPQIEEQTSSISKQKLSSSLLVPVPYKIHPLKKKVSYKQNLIEVKYDRKNDSNQQPSLDKSSLSSSHPNTTQTQGVSNQKQVKDQKNQQQIQRSEESSLIKQQSKRAKTSNNGSRNNSSVTGNLKKSILMLKTHKLSSILPEHSNLLNLQEMKNKDSQLGQSFLISKRSINQSFGIFSKQDYILTKSRKSVKEKQIKDVIQEAIKIRQSIELNEISVEPYMNDDLSNQIEILKQQYKQSGNQEQRMVLLIRIGQLFEKDDNIEAATKTYQKCIKFQSPLGFLKLGQLQLNKGQIASAIQNLEKAYHYYRRDVHLKLKLAYGYSLFQEGLQKAISITNSLILQDPTNLQAILLSSNIYQKQGQIETALEIIKAVDQQLINESIKHYMGLLHLQNSDIQQAYQCFRDALKINNKYVPSMIECATILSTNKPQDAIKIFKKVLKSQPKNQTALGRLAKIYQTQLEYAKAIQYYKILILMIESYGIYQSLGFCQKKTGEYAEAISHFKKAITFQSNVFSWKKIAQCYEAMKQYDKALNYYQITLKMDASAEVYRKIGLCMIHLQNFKGAIRNLKCSLDIQETLESYSTIANCHYLVGEYDEAINYYKKAISIKGYETNAYYNMAICYDQKQQFSRSKPLYQRILSQQPNNIKCLFNLANILLIMGKPNNALQLFEKGLLNDPNNHKRRLQIIELYEILNNLDKSQEHLLYCFEQDNEDKIIIQSLLRISRKKKDIKKVNHYTKLLQDVSTAFQSVLPKRSSIDKLT